MLEGAASSTGTWERTAAEKARPHKHMFSDEAHAFVCRLRTDQVEAKYWCPSLVDKHGKSTVHGRTNADEILLALVRKLGGEMTRSKGKVPENLPTRNHKHAAMFKLSRRKGRPNAETAVADAAVADAAAA